ncbi:D-sedoheptulose 7-phosphate isomerase [Gabonibacter chumensis]|uniref:D-sedoheptulose 7-phosphate isomerase n=1 Tax=Gabonibacter chumensis TaxID=2972474 RepID=UPI0025735656|nr:D-sedoheptulose 7-phosphate isomerase [Gabonibacter chumensis]MCR9010964.1 D-sedoheptulose 7-phosphate isomerase [Gabonibacter chumensis]
MNGIEKSFEDARQLLADFVADEENIYRIEKAGEILVGALREGKKALSCGNGGSLCDAMHFAEELTGRFRENRRALPAVAIADPSHLTCVANDFGFEYVFSRYVEAHGVKGDVLLAISTSGNSLNIVKAIEAAREKGMKVIGLTGKDGGKMREMCDVNICIPWNGYSDRIQEIHIKIIHILIEFIENKLFS